MLKREGVCIGGERLRRPYLEEGLSLRMRPKRRRKLTSHLRIVAPPPQEPHERWTMDFMVDSFMDGRRFRELTVVDIYSRHSPIIEADLALNGSKVVAALKRATKHFGYPRVIQVDNVLNASQHFLRGNSDPGRAAQANRRCETGQYTNYPVFFRGRAGEPCLTIVDTRFIAISA